MGAFERLDPEIPSRFWSFCREALFEISFQLLVSLFGFEFEASRVLELDLHLDQASDQRFNASA